MAVNSVNVTSLSSISCPCSCRVGYSGVYCELCAVGYRNASFHWEYNNNANSNETQHSWVTASRTMSDDIEAAYQRMIHFDSNSLNVQTQSQIDFTVYPYQLVRSTLSLRLRRVEDDCTPCNTTNTNTSVSEFVQQPRTVPCLAVCPIIVEVPQYQVVSILQVSIAVGYVGTAIVTPPESVQVMLSAVLVLSMKCMHGV